MKRRKNAVYTGQSTRGSTGDRGDRWLVDRFYERLNHLLFSDDEIEIIPPAQVNPTHNIQDQVFIMTDYCTRKILPEITSLFHWGAEVTQRLRALASVVDQKTAKTAANAAYAARTAANRAFNHTAAYATFGAPAARGAAEAAADTANNVTFAPAYVAFGAAQGVHFALIATIMAGDEAAYNRIIDLTNEMLESL